jgi:hypothetical protein
MTTAYLWVRRRRRRRHHRRRHLLLPSRRRRLPAPQGLPHRRHHRLRDEAA